MQRRVHRMAVIIVCVLSCAGSGHAQPDRVTKREEKLWVSWLIPLPKRIAIPEKVTLPARDTRLRVREGASDVEQHAAAELASLLGVEANADAADGGFDVLVGVCDGEGKLEGRRIPGAKALARLPNSEQAYVIRPMGGRQLALTALDERGVYYASRTLCQLLEGSLAGDKVTIPLARVTDWPDISERGEWGGSASKDVDWMAGYKLNLVEAHASLGLDDYGKGTATIDGELVESARLRALNLVPIIMHLDYLRSSGLYDRWPEVQGVGEEARIPVGGEPVALCFAQPKSTEILTDWMASLADVKGVTDINAWLSEWHGQCQCPECKEATERGLPQWAREVRAVGQAMEAARQTHPALRARVLLTQGSYPDNAKVLAATPPELQVTYYCGAGRERSTYNSSRDPMVYPLLEEYAGEGHWLGVYPQFTASYGTVCPWSGPQFIRHLMRELVTKGIDCVCGYTVPNNQLHDLNVTAAAEWSWNLNGRSEREFAIAWATRRGIEDPEAVGDWVELVGPVGWNIYGAGPAATPWLSVLQGSASLVEKRTEPRLGDGIWRCYRRRADMERDVSRCERALAIAGRLDVPELLQETHVIHAYAAMVRELYEIASAVAGEDPASDEVRLRLQEAMCRLASAGVQGVKALRTWKETISPDLDVPRFDGTVAGTERTVVTVADALIPFGIQDPSRPYRRQQIGEWSDTKLERTGRQRLTWEVSDVVSQPGAYRVEFDYTEGQNGLPIHRVALACAPKDRPEELTELDADEHGGFAGHESRENVYQVNLPAFDGELRYSVIVDVTVPSSTEGVVYMRLAGEPPLPLPVPELEPLTPEQRQLLESRSGSPVFEKSSLGVGVVQNGYGATSILDTLQEEERIDAQPVWRVEADTLSRCQVVILPQPRAVPDPGKERVSMLADFVRRGGGLITTHNAVGYRGLASPIPGVCARGTEHVRDEEWVVVADHPTTAGLPVNQPLSHSYYDHIELEAGPEGTVVACAAGSGRPVVVCGAYGWGAIRCLRPGNWPRPSGLRQPAKCPRTSSAHQCCAMVRRAGLRAAPILPDHGPGPTSAAPAVSPLM